MMVTEKELADRRSRIASKQGVRLKYMYCHSCRISQYHKEIYPGRWQCQNCDASRMLIGVEPDR